MAIYTIDTAEALKKLRDAECDEPLAEAIVGIVAARHDELATKTDLGGIRNEIGSVRQEVSAVEQKSVI